MKKVLLHSKNLRVTLEMTLNETQCTGCNLQVRHHTKLAQHPSQSQYEKFHFQHEHLFCKPYVRTFRMSAYWYWKQRHSICVFHTVFTAWHVARQAAASRLPVANLTWGDSPKSVSIYSPDATPPRRQSRENGASGATLQPLLQVEKKNVSLKCLGTETLLERFAIHVPGNGKNVVGQKSMLLCRFHFYFVLMDSRGIFQQKLTTKYETEKF